MGPKPWSESEKGNPGYTVFIGLLKKIVGVARVKEKVMPCAGILGLASRELRVLHHLLGEPVCLYYMEVLESACIASAEVEDLPQLIFVDRQSRLISRKGVVELTELTAAQYLMRQTAHLHDGTEFQQDTTIEQVFASWRRDHGCASDTPCMVIQTHPLLAKLIVYSKWSTLALPVNN